MRTSAGPAPPLVLIVKQGSSDTLPFRFSGIAGQSGEVLRLALFRRAVQGWTQATILPQLSGFAAHRSPTLLQYTAAFDTHIRTTRPPLVRPVRPDLSTIAEPSCEVSGSFRGTSMVPFLVPFWGGWCYPEQHRHQQPCAVESLTSLPNAMSCLAELILWGRGPHFKCPEVESLGWGRKKAFRLGWKFCTCPVPLSSRKTYEVSIWRLEDDHLPSDVTRYMCCQQDDWRIEAVAFRIPRKRVGANSSGSCGVCKLQILKCARSARSCRVRRWQHKLAQNFSHQARSDRRPVQQI